MTLLGPNSKTSVIAFDDDSDEEHNAKIVKKLDPSTYYVRITHFQPTGTGDYGISVQLQQ
jgi:tyrosinase